MNWVCIQCKVNWVCTQCKVNQVCIQCKVDWVCIQCRVNWVCTLCKGNWVCTQCKGNWVCIQCKVNWICIQCKECVAGITRTAFQRQQHQSVSTAGHDETGQSLLLLLVLVPFFLRWLFVLLLFWIFFIWYWGWVSTNYITLGCQWPSEYNTLGGSVGVVEEKLTVYSEISFVPLGQIWEVC